MATRQHLTPAPGLVVRDPATGKALPPEGAMVPINSYWRRRLADGDVTAAPAAKPARPAKAQRKEG